MKSFVLSILFIPLVAFTAWDAWRRRGWDRARVAFLCLVLAFCWLVLITAE